MNEHAKNIADMILERKQDEEMYSILAGHRARIDYLEKLVVELQSKITTLTAKDS